MNQNRDSAKLGTFAGVFTPSILTILGIILFLRTGYIVGQAGLLQTLLIIAASSGIALLTATSLSAIATNLRVKGGGDYYMISRTLGIEYGAPIGIVLFFALSLSIAFYCFGFGEALTALLPAHPLITPRTMAALLLVFLFVFAWLGADWASRLQLAIMTVIALALGSFFWGGISAWDAETLSGNWQRAEGGLAFWAAFALFFPALTGFTQGVSMSGDVEDPAKSLPLGTFAAIGVAILVYGAAAVVFAAALPADVLGADYQAMGRVAALGVLISAGVLAATASSAMASYLTGPRILQMLAADDAIPFLAPFAKGAPKDNNPRRGVLLSTLIAAVAILMGDLNAIAPIVAVFFLTSYVLLNYSTYFAARASSPSFRPQFRFFHKYLSLAGAAGCLVAILAIYPVAAVGGIAVLFSIYEYVKRTSGGRHLSDSRRAYNFQRVRNLLLEMNQQEAGSRDWRPQIIVLSRDRERRRHVLRFGDWIEGNSGIATAVSVLTEEEDSADLPEATRDELAEDIEELEVDVFPLVIEADTFRSGMEVFLQSYGIGPIKANIVLLNWLEEAPSRKREEEERLFGRNMREAVRLGQNIVALAASDEAFERIDETPATERRIDVWWTDTTTSRLALMLAYLMTRTEPWRDARICVHAQAADGDPEETVERLEEVLDEVRIRADIDVVEEPLDSDVLTEYAAGSSVTFIPIRLKGDRPTDFMDEPLRAFEEEPVVMALVLAGEDIDLEGDADEDDDAGGEEDAPKDDQETPDRDEEKDSE